MLEALASPAFNNVNNGTFCWARREIDRWQNQLNEVSGNTFALPMGVMPPIQPGHPVFNTGPTLYIPPITTIRSPGDMLSLALGRHIPNYETPRGFVIPSFTMFDGSTDPYDNMLHYNQTMNLMSTMTFYYAKFSRLVCRALHSPVFISSRETQ